MVQRGIIRIHDKDKNSQVIHVGHFHSEPQPGETRHQIYVIGVRMLLFDLTSTNIIETVSDEVEAWQMGIQACDAILIETNFMNHLQAGAHIMVLLQVALFKKLKHTDPRLRQLIMQCRTQECWQNDFIMEQGEDRDSFHALLEGTVQVEVGKVVATLTADIDDNKVRYFGEITILDRTPRQAPVRVCSTAATSLCVPVEAINDAFGSIDQLLQEHDMEASALKGAAAKAMPKAVADKAVSKKTEKKPGDVSKPSTNAKAKDAKIVSKTNK